MTDPPHNVSYGASNYLNRIVNEGFFEHNAEEGGDNVY